MRILQGWTTMTEQGKPSTQNAEIPAASNNPAASPVQQALAPSKSAAFAANEAAPASLFARYERDLFALYTRFRYNELVCRRLTLKATNLERWVRRSVVGTLAISLFSGVIPGMNQATLNWIWGSLTTVATLLTIYSLFEASGEKQFRWFQLAMRFRSSADQVEFFSDQVRRGKFVEDELAETWRTFRQELSSLVDGAGLGFMEFEEEHREELSQEIEAILRREQRAS
jgi:hypothetical protein